MRDEMTIAVVPEREGKRVENLFRPIPDKPIGQSRNAWSKNIAASGLNRRIYSAGAHDEIKFSKIPGSRLRFATQADADILSKQFQQA